MTEHPTTSESPELLGDLAEGCTSALEGRLGRLVRATGKFDASLVVTRGIQQLRLDLLNGAALTPVVGYLRALHRSQTFHIRNLAARAVLVLGERPLDVEERLIFLQAINAGDHQMADGPTHGAALNHQGRRDEAMALFEDAARWPWNNQAVDPRVWLLSDGMTASPGRGFGEVC